MGNVANNVIGENPEGSVRINRIALDKEQLLAVNFML
jgi:hypothetical protein